MFVLAQNLNSIIFWSSAKIWNQQKYAKEIMVKQKTFGPAQNILGPVEGRGIPRVNR
jgi:hypothetical protein